MPLGVKSFIFWGYLSFDCNCNILKFRICVHIHERTLHGVRTVPWNILKNAIRETPRMVKNILPQFSPEKFASPRNMLYLCR
jgi:hypothetical protein